MKNFLALIKPLGFILMVLSSAILFAFLLSLLKALPSLFFFLVTYRILVGYSVLAITSPEVWYK